MNTTSIPLYLKQKLKNELSPVETVIWIGQPNPRRHAKMGAMAQLLFIPFTAITIFLLLKDIGFSIPVFDSNEFYDAIFRLPFLLVGIYGLCLPWILKHKASTTIYAITNKRAILIEGKRKITVKSYTSSNITNLERVEHSDGTGNLIFKIELYRDNEGDEKSKQHGFFSIDDVKKVESLLIKNLLVPN